MPETHKHQFGAPVDLLPSARANGQAVLAEKLTELQGRGCPWCGQIAVTVQPEIELTPTEQGNAYQLAVDALGEEVRA